MKTTISDESGQLDKMIEETLFSDISGNNWKIQVMDDSMYLIYLGTELDRKDKFKAMSEDGFGVLLSHNNIFRFDENTMSAYFHLRDIVKGNITSVIWDFLQLQISKANFKNQLFKM